MLHGGLLYLALFLLPKFLTRGNPPPPSYTVRIVDNIPAGDLGMHLPRLSGAEKEHAPEPAQQQPPLEPSTKTEPTSEAPLAPDHDKNALALNNFSSASPTLTPTPTPQPTPAPTPEPTLAPTDKPTPAAASTPKVEHTAKPTAAAEPASRVTKSQPKAPLKPAAAIQLAKAEPTPSVQDQLAKIRKQLMAQHLANEKAHADNDESDDEGEGEPGATPADKGKSGGGPVVGPVASAGAGFGIGEGTGSAGVLKNLDFLLYYRTVQERVKKAWNFSGGSPDLAATVTFSIGADGSLTDVKVTQSSNDSAYDDSVVRAIRKAAPFPPPPAQYRDQFGGGIEALFKLGEMNS